MSTEQRKSINKENTGAIPKTVMFKDEASCKMPQDNKAKAICFSNLDTPRLNRLSELRKTLNEIKNYDAKITGSKQDISDNSQQLMNRVVSKIAIN